MSLSTEADVAMVLPIPLGSGSTESAVAVINLEKHEQFFSQLESAWPPRSFGFHSRGAAAAGIPLVVKSVGAYEASFVPTVADFSRLDERFRLPESVWAALPGYRNVGFVVFKLRAGRLTVHPRAFSFPRADVNSVFFPAVHIHDGTVPKHAVFDHELFLQTRLGPDARLSDWDESPLVASQVMSNERGVTGLIAPDQHIYRQTLRGRHENSDIIIAAGGYVAPVHTSRH